jgi:hypothetical protein
VTTQKKRPANQKGGRAQGARPTRGQQVAMKSRSTPVAAPETSHLDLAVRLDGPTELVDPVVADNAPAAPLGYAAVPAADATAPRRGVLPSRIRGRSAARVYALTREQEYAYIQEDLRRLLIVAAVLMVFMVSLLFVLGR